MSAAQDATSLLTAISHGDHNAVDRLMPLIYDELHQLAERFMRQERPDHTLQTTALVNEAYLKLVDQTRVEWQNRTHFLAVAATAMRRILVNHAKARGRVKRGGGALRETSLDESALVAASDNGSPSQVDLVHLDDAMGKLAAIDPRKARVVELRYFGGLSVEEAAQVLGVGSATVKRDWDFARTWLLREISS